MKAVMKKSGVILFLLGVVGCSSQYPQVNDAEAQSRLAHLERWEGYEYQKATKRDEEQYQTSRSRTLDALQDEKIALQNERIHYQNQAIQYQNSRQRTKDLIDDIGQIQMNEAKAINKANENISKQKNVNNSYIFW